MINSEITLIFNIQLNLTNTLLKYNYIMLLIHNKIFKGQQIYNKIKRQKAEIQASKS